MTAGRRESTRWRRPTWRGAAAGLVAAAAVAAAGPAADAAEPRQITLEESLRLASERNLRIQSARSEASEFAEEVPKAFKEFFPKLRAEARYYLQTPRPQIINPAGSTPVPPQNVVVPGVGTVTVPGRVLPEADREIVAGQRTDYNLRLRLEQPLFAGHRLTSAYAAAQLDERIGGARLTRAQQEVAEQVKAAYFEVLKAEALRQAGEARVSLQEAEIRYTEGLVAGGRATANALPPLRAALAAARQEVFEASQRADVSLQDLKRLVGLDESEAVRPASPPEERVLAMEAADAARMAQNQRPELRELALTTDRALEGITQARGGYYPRIGLFGVYDKARQTVLNPRGEFVAGGIEATWNLGDWGRTKHEVAQAEYRHDRAVTDLRDRRAAVGQEARAAFAEVRVAERRATALRAEVEAARNAAQVAEERLRGDVGVVRDVVVARAEAARALARYRAAVYDGYLVRARLERILGAAELPTAPGGPALALDFPTDASSLELIAKAPAFASPAVPRPVPAEPPRPAVEAPPPAPAPVTPEGTAPRGEPPRDSGSVAARTIPTPPTPPRLPSPPGVRWIEEPAMRAAGGFSIAVSALESRDEANALGRLLIGRGFGPLEIRPESGAEGETFRIVLVGFRTRQTAERAARDVRTMFQASDGAAAIATATGAGADPQKMAPTAEARSATTPPATTRPAAPEPPPPSLPSPAVALSPAPLGPAVRTQKEPPVHGPDKSAASGVEAPPVPAGRPAGEQSAAARPPAPQPSVPAPAREAARVATEGLPQARRPAAHETAAPPADQPSGPRQVVGRTTTLSRPVLQLPAPAGMRWLEESATGGADGTLDIAVAALANRTDAEAFGRLLVHGGFGPLDILHGPREGESFRIVLVGFRTSQTAERAARDVRAMFQTAGSRAVTPESASRVSDRRQTSSEPHRAVGDALPYPPPPPEALPRRAAAADAPVPPPAAAGHAPLGPGGPGTPAGTAGHHTAAGRRGFDATVAAFRDDAEARRVAALLAGRGFGPVQVLRAGGTSHLVLTGFSSPETAERAARDARQVLGAAPIAAVLTR